MPGQGARRERHSPRGGAADGDFGGFADKNMATRSSNRAEPEPPAADTLSLPDGAQATLVDGALELRDARGRLLLRYARGRAEVHAADGDLELAAPNGSIRLRAGMDVELAAPRDVLHRAGERLEVCTGGSEQHQMRIDEGSVGLRTPRLEVDAGRGQVRVARGRLVADRLATAADTVVQRVSRYELRATHLVERTRETVVDVAEVLHTRAGRSRTWVRGLFSLRSGRTVMTSEQETKIDGKQVLLG